jgi:hypothetical protein
MLGVRRKGNVVWREVDGFLWVKWGVVGVKAFVEGMERK